MIKACRSRVCCRLSIKSSFHPFRPSRMDSHLCALFPEVPTDKLASMASLRSLNLRANPVGPEVRLLVRPLVPFDLLLSPEEPIPKV